MKATFIKGNQKKLEGKVLAYLDVPEDDGPHAAILAAANLCDFLELYGQHLKNTGIDASELGNMIKAAEKIDFKGQKNIIIAKINILNPDILQKQYECDILEIDSSIPLIVPQQMLHDCHLQLLDKYVEFYFDNYHIQKPEKKQIIYSACMREEWRKHFLGLHACLLEPALGKTYDVIEGEIKKACEKSPVPETIITSMLYAARKEQNSKRKKIVLNLYKDLIFALEDQNYESAAKIRDEIKKYKL